MKKSTLPAAIALAAALTAVGAPAANATYSHPSHTTTVSQGTKSGHDAGKYDVGAGTYDLLTGKYEIVKDVHGVIWTKVHTLTSFGWAWKWYC
ncbi:hypothetical protein [Kocuria sp. ZOR0020]|uniref:hypothetical protein n=1 Tax=Kocuria sp. ZOR0020 TaxID=1339234 RepID=UPI000646A66C|nr:hypothetical protein [Kocuria sp. ZOR0020]